MLVTAHVCCADAKFSGDSGARTLVSTLPGREWCLSIS